MTPRKTTKPATSKKKPGRKLSPREWTVGSGQISLNRTLVTNAELSVHEDVAYIYEPCGKSIGLTKSDFNRLIDWYTRKQAVRG